MIINKWRCVHIKFFISSHGHLASGIKSSLTILLGNVDNITVFDAFVDESSVAEHLDDFYKSVSDSETVILLSDIYGGSVNQTMSLYADRPNTTLIAGINMPLVIELLSREGVTRKEISDIVEQSRLALRIVEINTDEGDTSLSEDFF